MLNWQILLGCTKSQNVSVLMSHIQFNKNGLSVLNLISTMITGIKLRYNQTQNLLEDNAIFFNYFHLNVVYPL
jgi:hypothetical protein